MLLASLVASAAFMPVALSNPVGTIGTVTKQTSIQKLESGSELVALYSDPSYVDPIYVLSLHGTKPYDQGYDAATLFGKQIADNYQNLFDGLFKDMSRLEPKLQPVVEAFLDWQWTSYLSKEVPQEYIDELAGLSAGGIAAGVTSVDVGKASSWGITLANMPGDVEDIIYVLLDEFKAEKISDLTQEQQDLLPKVREAFKRFKGHHCSMFGVWGSRTQDGHLFSARNLDWLTDLGVNAYKLITVHHPADGHAHCTVGFAGIWGAMAGMSSQGLTAHEANLESKLSSFRGFPWILRLREVMKTASNIDQAMQVWTATNNTVGFNHMIGSANDQQSVCMETMSGYTATFGPMDPREDGALDPQTGEVYGYTLPEAVYRTNHGYDPVTQENYQWYGYHAYEDSKRRYKAIHDAFVGYETDGVKIGAPEAVVVTSTVGIKGDGTDENSCNPDLYLKGENIMSVTYDPTARTLYTAFEDGTGDNWVPAACNAYVKIDMTQWM